MIEVGLYIFDSDGVSRRIELYKDETISVTSSVQNVNDISKIFTDFSQSFTIPATASNNAIFQHWYENSIDGGFDARTRKNGYIELNTIRFRTGKIQLEKATLKNGQISNYTISFVGSLVSLKDLFADRYLRDFDFSAFDFVYNGANVKNAVTGGVTNDIKWPLISSNNVWQWGTNGGTRENWDINKTSHPVYYYDLFPAIRISKIFEIFETQMGIDFQGSFLASDRFKRAFLWLKNTDSFKVKSTPNLLAFDTVTSTVGTQGIFNLADNYLDFVKPTSPNRVAESYLSIAFATAGVEYTIFTYLDGISVSQQTYTSATTSTNIPIPLTDSGRYSFYIASTSALTLSANFTYYFEARDGSNNIYQNVTATNTEGQAVTTTLDVGSYMPNIKAQDFFAGILKMFNLVCYSVEDNIYKLEQLDDWYDSGSIIPIDEYVLLDEIGIERVKPYKAVNFNYQPSENLLATEFLSRSSIPYGDLKYATNNDGEEFTIELPFENLLFNKIDTNVQVSYCIRADYSTYIPKPVVLYDWGTIVTTGDWHFNDGTSTTIENSMNVFGQDTSISGSKFTLNWNAEQSTFTEQLEQNSLFNTYYIEYISNLFTDKARIVKIKAKLPLRLLNSLKLNDRVVIRDKRYLINSFSTNLTTGMADFELINDFRIPTNIPEPQVAYSFNVTNSNSTSSSSVCGLTSYPLVIYGNNAVFENNTVFYTNATLTDAVRFNGGNYYFKNPLGKWVVIDASGNVTSNGVCSTPPPPTLYAFSVTNANSIASADACPITDFNLTIYGLQPVFVNNITFYSNTSLTPFNGGNYYYHCNDDTFAKIGVDGSRLEFGTCSFVPPASIPYYVPPTNSILG